MGKIVETLVSQHVELRKLSEQIEQTAVQSDDIALLINLQESFLMKLRGHLALENDFFYPTILAGMKQKDTSSEQIGKTEQFIGEMKDIERSVIQFFSAYKEAEVIREKKEEYLSKLKEIISAFIMRIETEEDSVYLMWDFFGTKE